MNFILFLNRQNVPRKDYVGHLLSDDSSFNISLLISGSSPSSHLLAWSISANHSHVYRRCLCRVLRFLFNPVVDGVFNTAIVGSFGSLQLLIMAVWSFDLHPFLFLNTAIANSFGSPPLLLTVVLCFFPRYSCCTASAITAASNALSGHRRGNIMV